MAGKKLLQRLLRMKGFRISWFELYERKRRVFIGVKPHKTGCRCPQGDRRCAIVTILAECRVWRDGVLCGMEVFFYHPREILCPTHGRVQENIPWADA